MRVVLLIGACGALGSIGRYALSGLAHRWLGDRFAWGTLLVNVLGCFLLALVTELALERAALSREARIAAGVGFLGAFTTFSTFGYDTMQYVAEGAWGTAVLNVVLNVALGLGAVWAGLQVARFVPGGA